MPKIDTPVLNPPLPAVILSASDLPAKTSGWENWEFPPFQKAIFLEFPEFPPGQAPYPPNFRERGMVLANHPLCEYLVGSIEELARGEIIARPYEKGHQKLWWWFVTEEEQEKIVFKARPFIEAIPEDPLPPGLSMTEWMGKRFPYITEALGQFESLYRYLHAIWRSEQSELPPLEPDESWLYFAAVENYEHLLSDIVQGRRIVLSPRRTLQVTETALGVALENQGVFGRGMGYFTQCLRKHREKHAWSTEREKDDWTPRAERIEKVLREAGAVDYSPLLEACKEGDLGAVRRMLDEGFPPNFSVYAHTTALFEAANFRRLEVCRLLLERGANPNLPIPFKTRLMVVQPYLPLSVVLDDPQFWELLLDAGADPALHADDHMRVPAVFYGEYATPENASRLFQRVDFASIRSDKGKTGVHFLSAEDLELCRDFIPPYLINIPDNMASTPLVDAIYRYDVEKAHLLLDMGASVKVRGLIEYPTFNHHVPLFEYLPCYLTPAQAALLVGDYDLLIKILKLDPAPDPTAWKDEYFFVLHRYKSPVEYDVVLDFLLPIMDAACEASRSGTTEQSLAAISSRKMPPTPSHYGGLLPVEECKRRYQEKLIKPFNLLEVAEQMMLPRQLFVAWRAGRPLTAPEWLHLASKTLQNAQEAVDEYQTAYEDYLNSETESAPTYGSILRWIDQAAEQLERAQAQLHDDKPRPFTLSSGLIGMASQEFINLPPNGKAHADNPSTGRSFIHELRELVRPGSTLDVGKLLSSARNAITTMKDLHAELVSHL